MNIENITALSSQLQQIGLENALGLLAKRICFRQAKFILTKKIERENDVLNLHFHFQKDRGVDTYRLLFYDAVLLKDDLSQDDKVLNGISLILLEKQMSEINWKNAFDLDADEIENSDEHLHLEVEEAIEKMIHSLNKLEEVSEG